MIVEKTDIKSNQRDAIILVLQNAKSVKITSFIKEIKSHSFSYSTIEKDEIPCDSNLQIIGKNVFKHSGILNIFIFPNIKHISKLTFSGCKYLQNVEFYPDSNLRQLKMKLF